MRPSTPSAHQPAGGRAVAAVLAVLLSGAPSLAVDHAGAAEHRCQCRSHGEHHECDCAVCRAAALRARRAAVEKLPPCHRAAARKALEREDPQRPEGAGPWLAGTCGTPEARLSPPAGTDAFIVPPVREMAVLETIERVAAWVPRPHDGGGQPETPPPRAA